MFVKHTHVEFYDRLFRQLLSLDVMIQHCVWFY